MDGTVLQDSRDKEENLGPKTFKVGDKNAVIRGINYGVVGLKKGGKYILNIPSNLGIQKRDPSMDTSAPLDFEIEVLDVK
jgi:FKBP-type peptidyl-prolyl cis-trans isomerase